MTWLVKSRFNQKEERLTYDIDMSNAMLLLKENVYSFCEVSEYCQLL